MTQKKRITAFLLALCILVSPMLGLTSAEANDTIQDPVEVSLASTDYEFDVETQTIKKYLGTDTEVSIPQAIDGTAVLALGPGAFARKNLTKVEIPEGIETIGQSALGGQKITELNLPSTIRRINRLGFGANASLSSVKLNEGLVYIGQQAFMNDKALPATFDIPSTVETVMTSAFSGTNITKLNIAGDEDSAKILLKSGLAPNLDTVDLESPFKKLDFTFNTFGCTEKTNHVNLGAVSVTAQSAEELKTWLDENIPVRIAYTYVNKADATGATDDHRYDPLVWNTENYTDSGEPFQVTGTINKRSNEDFPAIEGYTSPNPGNCSATNLFNLEVTVTPAPSSEWSAEDFTYSDFEYKGNMAVPVQKFGISGLTEAGKTKLATNPNLVIPKTVTLPDGEGMITKNIEGILPNAFNGIAMESVTFPETKGEWDFIIGGTAFESASLERVTLSEGIKAIGVQAFRDNQLTEVFIPSTVLSLGSGAFQNNQIATLDISDDVELIQIDNYAFTNNQLKSVNLPYSIFKFRNFVFKGNPGEEALPADKLTSDDPAGTGVVYLYTRNDAHLGSETYIALSDYHKLIRVGEGTNRTELWNAIQSANHIYTPDYPDEAIQIFQSELNLAKDVFGDVSATQAQIDAAKDKLIAAIATLRASSADKTALRDLVNRGDELIEGLFTEESWSAFTTILNESKELLKDKVATEEQLNIQIQSLQKAMDELVISENAYFTQDDFTYDGNSITGFSETGKQKFTVNKNVVLPEKSTDDTTIESIGKEAFIMPSELVEFGTDVISSPEGIQTLRLPSTLKRIEEGAFRHNNLAQIDLPNGLEYIGPLAFNGNQLKSLTLPNSVVEMKTGAFSLNLLEDVKLSTSLKTIENGVFSRNIKLQSIELHEGLETIGESAFIGAPIKSLTFPSTLTQIDRRAFSSHRLTELTIPGTLKIIGRDAFAHNLKFRTLQKLTLEEGVESIGTNAFASGLLESVHLPNSLRELGDTAFRDNIDSQKNPVIVQLYTKNPAHMDFNNEKSMKNQIVILVDTTKEDLIQELKELLSEIGILKKADYTKSSWDQLAVETEKAKDALSNEETTVDELRSLIADINAKKSALIKASTDSGTPTKPDPKPGPVNPADPDPKPNPIDPDQPGKKEIPMTRIAGADRYQTAIAINKELYESADTVFFASGANFPDALTAAPLAAMFDAPLLLYHPNALVDVRGELDRLGASKIMLIGGEASISAQDEATFEKGYDPDRLAGSDRYETAAAIAAMILEKFGSQGKVIVADGRNYPDALAIAPYAAQEGLPILLSNRDEISASQLALLEKYGIKEAILIGGTSSVGSAVEDHFDHVTRIYGQNRYETAAKIAQTFFPTSTEVCLASGEVFADALAVSGFAAYNDMPILLTNGGKLDPSTLLFLEENNTQKLWIIGGDHTIPDSILKQSLVDR
ncbi:MAG: leucine-rich repeat protein [Tissierellia bacterium]|nr:leucine-rich repeat protein [Tissierellia bacterium]